MSEPPDGDYALHGPVGIESLQQGARLAGLAGGVLLIMVALMAWLGTSLTGLDSYWLAWAAVPACLAAFGGPYLARQLLSRHLLVRWRLLLLAVMSLNTTAWTYAAVIAVAGGPGMEPMLVFALLAQACALLPMLFWRFGLLLQLAVQLMATMALAVYPEFVLVDFVLPLGSWGVLAMLALAAAVYAHRVDLGKADSYYMRYELSELQHQLRDGQEHGRQMESQCRTLEAELAEILDLAEAASRAKNEFLATMSHEIRTPMNGILPILEMLRESRLDPEQLKMVDTAQSSSRHLLRIINDILDFAKVESGKLELESIEIDVHDLVDAVTELMSGSARNHNLKVSASVAENVPKVVRGDPVRLRQILINLVSNAIKFTEEGGIRIEVSRGQTSQKEVELLFAVADTGVGMSEETADRLFQSFTQADASTTRKHGGTGLGLVICKRLVELMGGKIGVRSVPGQGSTFWFLIPLRKSVMEVPSARRDLNGVRILTLISDEELAARVSGYLHNWGVVETSASDAADALAKMRSTSTLGESWGPQLALIDGAGMEQRLPNLLAEIRNIEPLKNMRIVLLLTSDALAYKLKRDFGVLILAGGLRPEPLRRMLYRLFDVESRHFGNTALRPEEIYDDLNVSAPGVALEQSAQVVSGPELSGQVLLVEDNPVNLGVVKKVLSKLGLRCETAADGSEALAQCRRQRFDLILMDCQMPVMDGYEATRQIRELDEAQGRPPTTIVAMTANAMAGDREKCIAAGMDDYLAKPVGLGQLRKCVANWLGASGGSTVQLPSETPAVVEGEVIDDAVLRELQEIMDEDYLDLLRTYLRHAPELVEQIRKAIEGGDAAAMVLPVHSLKSSSANVGAMRLSELARQAEQLAKAGDLIAAEAAFRAVDAAFGVAESALKEHLARKSHQANGRDWKTGFETWS
jgi:signal transduction histidine kinase/CheY-like chemotaxis protein